MQVIFLFLEQIKQSCCDVSLLLSKAGGKKSKSFSKQGNQRLNLNHNNSIDNRVYFAYLYVKYLMDIFFKNKC